jgi:Kef-type K+ transport system membrane component KefB
MALDVFVELGIIVFVAFVMAALMRFLRQPLIISYILSGIVLGPFVLNVINSPEELKTFAEIGIAVLLFMVGISINPKVIKEVGKASLVTGMGQIVFTSLIGFAIAMLLGFSTIVSLYIAIALTFSSTIIIMKLLSDKGDLETLYGRIAVGFLIVQDLVAILIMLVVSSMAQDASIYMLIFGTIIKGGLLIGGLFVISSKILPAITKSMAKSQELLFMFSIAWCLSISTLFYFFDFSIEIGALLAGVTLSLSPYRYEINSKMKPLRDFFISLFFIYLGSQLMLGDVSRYIVPIILFSAFILIGNPLVVVALMGMMGYERRVGFLSGLTVAQISEFSLILVALGVKVGHLTPDILSLVTVIGIFTIAGSTYLIMYSDKIFPYISDTLRIFERKKKVKIPPNVTESYDILLFGYHRIGHELLEKIKSLKKRYLVVDYDPSMIEELEKKGLNCKYGDAADSDFLDELPFAKAQLIISTIPDTGINLLLINKCREIGSKAVIIAVSQQINDSLILYEAGASYVIMPYFLGAHHTSSIIADYGVDMNKYLHEKIKHLGYLSKLRRAGHEHPVTKGH